MRLSISSKESKAACYGSIVELRDQAGVYQILSANAEVIYVGMSRDLNKRLQNYLKPPRGKRGRKARHIMKEGDTILVEKTDNSSAARILELEIIQRLRPKHNIDGAFYFLYPFIGFRTVNDSLEICYTTNAEAFAHFRLFGAFRGLAETRGAFDALALLLKYAGHPTRPEPGEKVKYSSVKAFRQIPAQTVLDMTRYLEGQTFADRDFLVGFADALLERPSARANAGDIQKALRTLKMFFSTHVEPLRDLMCSASIKENYLPQTLRDRLVSLQSQSKYR